MTEDLKYCSYYYREMQTLLKSQKTNVELLKVEYHKKLWFYKFCNFKALALGKVVPQNKNAVTRNGHLPIPASV